MINVLSQPHSLAKRAPACRPAGRSLAEAAPGAAIRLVAYGDVPVGQASALQAYGLIPGQVLRVLQQRPVTVVLVEQTELAFENQIARQIIIEETE